MLDLGGRFKDQRFVRRYLKARLGRGQAGRPTQEIADKTARVERARAIVEQAIDESGFASRFEQINLVATEGVVASVRPGAVDIGATLNISVGMAEALGAAGLGPIVLHEVGELKVRREYMRRLRVAAMEGRLQALSFDQMMNQLDEVSREKEFTCDAFAIEHGASVDDFVAALKESTKLLAERKGIPFAQAYADGGKIHPSPAERVAFVRGLAG